MLQEIEYGQYRGKIQEQRGDVDIYVALGRQAVVVRTTVYDGVHEYPLPGIAFDPRSFAEQEMERLRGLLAAGKRLSDE